MRHLLPLIPFLAAGPLAALDLFDVADLRAHYGPVGGTATVETSTPGGDSRGEFAGRRVGLDLALGVDVLFLGVMGGVGAAADRRTVGSYQREAVVGRAFAGPYFAIGPVNVELTGNLGKGRARLERGLAGLDSTDPVQEYGVDGAISVALGHLVVGGGGGWLHTRSEHGFTWPGPAAVTITSSGWQAAAFAGWRF